MADDLGVAVGGVIVIGVGGALLFGIYSGISGLTNISGAVREQDAKNTLKVEWDNTTDTLTEKLKSVGLQVSNITPKTMIADAETGKISGIMSYEAPDKDGDLTTYVARYEAKANTEDIQKFEESTHPFDKKYNAALFEEGVIRDAGINYLVPFGGISVSKEYKKACEGLSESYASLVDGTEKFEITPLGEQRYFNFGSRLLNVSDVAVNSDCTMARFYVDYIGDTTTRHTDGTYTTKKNEYKQIKYNIDIKDFDGTIKEQLTDYVFTKFAEKEIDSQLDIMKEEVSEKTVNQTAVNLDIK